MNTIAIIWLLFWLLRISIEDIRSYTIPNPYVLALLASAPFLENIGLAPRLAAFALPWLLCPLMGMGDVKLYAALGLCLGLSGLLWIGAASMLAGGFLALILLLLKKAAKKDRMPFGPCIAAAAACYVLFAG